MPAPRNKQYYSERVMNERVSLHNTEDYFSKLLILNWPSILNARHKGKALGAVLATFDTPHAPLLGGIPRRKKGMQLLRPTTTVGALG